MPVSRPDHVPEKGFHDAPPKRGRPTNAEKAAPRHLKGYALWNDGWRAGYQTGLYQKSPPQPGQEGSWEKAGLSGLTREAVDFAEILAEFVAFEGHRNGYDEMELLEKARKALRRHAPDVLHSTTKRAKAWIKEQEG